MTPQEIRYSIQQLPALKEAFNATERAHIWRILRQEVKVATWQGGICSHCNAHAELLFETPYNGPYPGWCITCMLQGLADPDTPRYDKYRDPRSPYYNATYDQGCKFWEDFYTTPEDYDGPPIVMA